MRRSWAAAAVATAVVLAGCGGGAGNLPVVREGDRLTSPASDLVARIPPSLGGVSDDALARAYRAGAREPACRTSDGGPVELVLVQACGEIHRRFLFPEGLPSSLDGFESAEAYTAEVHRSDRFTVYFPPTTYQSVIAPTVRGTRAGVGILLATTAPDGVVGPATPLEVVQVLPFSRAWFDGLRAGDRVKAVDGRPTNGLTAAEALALVPTTEGASVRFTIERDNDSFVVDTAARFHLSFRLGDDLAYLGVRTFADTTGSRVRDGFRALVEEGGETPTGIVVDLRANGGGSVAGALALADWLIDADRPARTHPLLFVEDRAGRVETRYLGDHAGANLPVQGADRVVVLVDAATASAAEIVVAALRDYGAATVVGMTTFGKGVREDSVPLVDGAGLRVTSRHLLPPSGVSYHGTGIPPDLVVPGSPWDGTVTPDDDPQLAAAVAFLRGP